jgi:hypothetical protein
MAAGVFMSAASSAQDRPEPPDVLVEAPPLPDQPAERSYWLGVECEPISNALRAQLKLEGDHGLLVGGVAPDSPAAKAGIQENDILLLFNEARLAEVADLSGAVADAKDRESTLRLIRGGESRELKVTPQKRPENAVRPPHAAPPGRDVLRRWLPFEPGEEPFRMLFLRPGMMGPFGFAAPELPKDSSLTIAREGDEPAKITYRKGDQTWEASAEQIDELPEEVRPFARRALGVDEWAQIELRGPDGQLFRKGFSDRSPGGPAEDDVPKERRLFRNERRRDSDADKAPEAESPDSEAPESAIGELRRAVQELRQELQKLREERAADRSQ